ncbi:nitroreductase [Eggerthellaceae bacterium zg-887]|nr:nitroreductase [Xiamenia xianingshaonis]
MDVLGALRNRRSVRVYSEEPIPSMLLDRIIEAGLLSASGRARRPWELVVVRDRAMLAALAQCRDSGAAMLSEADAAIVVVADAALSDTWVEDCSIVMANMHLEAAACGVGSCWIQGRMRQAADGRSTQEYVADLLGLPDNMALEAILSLGMPASAAVPHKADSSLWTKVRRIG